MHLHVKIFYYIATFGRVPQRKLVGVDAPEFERLQFRKLTTIVRRYYLVFLGHDSFRLLVPDSLQHLYMQQRWVNILRNIILLLVNNDQCIIVSESDVGSVQGTFAHQVEERVGLGDGRILQLDS